VEWIEDDEANTTSKAGSEASSVLSDMSSLVSSLSFDTLPVPHLDEYDAVSLDTGAGLVTFSMTQWTIPLTPVESMSVGYNKSTHVLKRVTS
jgi:hypothetical protein